MVRFKISLVWLVLAIPIVNALASMFTPYFPAGGLNPGTVRGVVLTLFVVYFIFTRFDLNPPNSVIAAFLIYCFGLVFLQSSNPVGALYHYFQMLLWAAMFPIGYWCIRTVQDLGRLHNVYVLVLFIFTLELILANLFGFGVTNYAHDSLSFGSQGVNVTKSMGLILLMSPLLLRLSHSRNLSGLMVVAFLVSGVFVLLGISR